MGASTGPERRSIGPGLELDLAGEELWREGRPVALRPKSWLVLRHLSSKPGTLVSLDELFDVAWPGTAVTPGTVANVINELRRALGDNATAPAFIQTVHRRGFRWLATPSSLPDPHSSSADATSEPSQPHSRIAEPTLGGEPGGRGNDVFVGRRSELAMLADLWKGSTTGQRRIVFVGGDAGIGKTTLVAELVRSIDAGDVLVAQGAAVESYGELEAFLPFFSAIDGLLSRERQWLLPLLERVAPSWLAQMPWARQAGQLPPPGGAHSMLREGAALWEAISARKPLLLVLEDLHVADHSTVALIEMLAEKTGAARLLLVGTWRTAQAIASEHPIATAAGRLRQSRRATQILLSPLSQDEIRAWLTGRLASKELASSLVESLERISEGNPLFLSALFSHAIERGILCNENGAWQIASASDAALRDLPDDLRGIVDAQLEALGPDAGEALEVASAAGLRFVAQDVGGGMNRPAEVADALCHRLAKSRHFLRALGEVVRPDGTRSGEYEFVHSLYRQACYERLAPARRQLVHQRIALAMEKAHGTDCHPVVHQLAVQFEAADDVARSVEYFVEAVRSATCREERAEAHARLDEARERLHRRPQSRERDFQEIELLFGRIAASVIDHERFGDEFIGTSQSAERIALRIGDPERIFVSRMGIGIGLILQGRPQECESIADQLLAMSTGDAPTFRVQALNTAACVCVLEGELERAATALAEAVQLDPHPARPRFWDQRSWVPMLYAYVLSLLGRFREADAWVARAVALGEAAELPPSLSILQSQAAEMYALRGDRARAAEHNERAAEIQRTFAGDAIERTRVLASWLAGSTDDAELDSMEAATVYRSSAWSALLATAQRASGRLDGALRTIEDYLVYSGESGAALLLPEMHRERGEIALAQSAVLGDAKAIELAEAQFREASRIARHQHSRLFELRATNALARLLQRTGRSGEAITQVRAMVEAFDGEDSCDVEEARALLTSLGC